MSRKGQINSIDFMIAVLIFAVILVFLIGFWFLNMAELSEMMGRDRLDSTSIAVSDMLIKTPGVPENWEDGPSDVWAIGLATTQNVLSKEKVANFTALDYNESREIMGLDGDYYFYIEDLDGNRLHEAGVAELGEGVAPVLRFGILEGEIVKVEVFVHG
ncbi:hypothetical protein JW721_04735 [Candidatus Micrarchaeota archaeon]|nr:hypothetical protein [Candidatus Micrarchaeota archaeon]